ncbi:potassium channel KOR1-like [Wolffia australiana]
MERRTGENGDSIALGEEEEFVVEDVPEANVNSTGSRFALLARELRMRAASRDRLANGLVGCCSRFIIDPENKLYRLWTRFILLWAIYSSFFTPLEFGFFRGLPENLLLLDIAGQFAFLVDIFVRFFLAFRDERTYRMIYSPRRIALRYVKGGFFLDLLSCLPWDIIYKAAGRKEEVRYFLWIRLCRVRRVEEFFQSLEKDIRINYLFTRIVKLIVVELYCTHTAACIFYYLATTLPSSMEGYTWIGSLQLGDYSYKNFRDLDLFKRYITSLYFAIITMATVGYGDIHAVNVREMVFIIIFVSFDMILGAYLIGNMTALIVKGSNTERYRDKMAELIRYMNRNKLMRDIRTQIKGHVRLQYDISYADTRVLQDMPISIRAKISRSLYRSFIEKIPLFRGCSTEFLNQIVVRLQEEFFLPGELILEQGSAVDQLYFVNHGSLEGVVIGEDGSEETILKLEAESSFGEVAMLCNIPQPFTVRVSELSRLLRLDKQSFTSILQIYFFDSRAVFKNLLSGHETTIHQKQLESDISFHVGKQEAELALKVNNAAFHGDLQHLKGLIRGGADPNKTDYDGRSPLHHAASRGFEDAILFLLQEGAHIDIKDKFGNTPLLEAIKNGHDRVASLLVKRGAVLALDDAGSRLCQAVANGNVDFLKRVLTYGVDPDSKDYDHRTPLHLAAAEGLYVIAKILLEAGASPLAEDRWGNTPLDEARKCGSRPIIKLLDAAKAKELIDFPEQQRDLHKLHPVRCTVFPFHPWDPPVVRREGVVMWVPRSMDDLVKAAQDQLSCSGCRILSEDGGRIPDIEMISNGQKLYLPPSTSVDNDRPED